MLRRKAYDDLVNWKNQKSHETFVKFSKFEKHMVYNGVIKLSIRR